jgi:predicted Zn-dependent peptidase
MPQYANENWYNAHNFYGDLADLDSAKLEDVQSFFKTFYSPNNAVLVVTGDFAIADAKNWIDKYFSAIPPAQLPPKPDLKEPVQEKEKKFTKEDKLAKKPALAVAYKMPERNTPEYYAMGLIDQILVQGQDSKLYNLLVQQKGYSNNVNGGINIGLGNMYDYNGPMLWTSNITYDSTISSDSIIHQYDIAINDLQKVTAEDLQLSLVKLRSGLYDALGGNFGIGKINLLACFALFDDNPSKINALESEFKKITPELIHKTAKQYLRSTNRTILIIEPKAPK